MNELRKRVVGGFIILTAFIALAIIVLVVVFSNAPKTGAVVAVDSVDVVFVDAIDYSKSPAPLDNVKRGELFVEKIGS